MSITQAIKRNTWWDHLEDSLLYFTLNSTNYRNGTIVKLNETYMNKHHPGLFGHACFNFKREEDNTYLFYAVSLGSWKVPGRCGWFAVKESDLSYAIAEIIRPFKVHVHTINYKNDFHVKGLVRTWIIYLFVLFFSLVFNEFYIIWIMASFVFFTYRKAQLSPVTYLEDIL